MWEVFEHTADVGFRVRAATRRELFQEAARALTALLIEQPETIRPAESRTVRVEAEDEPDLLHDWLEEILFHYAARHFIFVQFDIVLEENSLEATAWGEPFDPERHSSALDIKAITYHQLRVAREHGEWTAQVIVDI